MIQRRFDIFQFVFLRKGNTRPIQDCTKTIFSSSHCLCKVDVTINYFIYCPCALPILLHLVIKLPCKYLPDTKCSKCPSTFKMTPTPISFSVHRTISSHPWVVIPTIVYYEPFTTQFGHMPCGMLSSHEYTASLKLAALDSSFSLSISPKLNGKCAPGSVSLP